jgi:hypothetical protein
MLFAFCKATPDLVYSTLALGKLLDAAIRQL